MAENHTGKITQVIGAVLDIKFSSGELPEINDAVEIPLKNGERLVVEVAQHLGDDTVRCIAMGTTDGLVRGMEAKALGGPISVPVGEETLGRMFNVLGEPIDRKPAPKGAKGCRFTDRHRNLVSSLQIRRCWKQELKLLISFVRIKEAEKSDYLEAQV